MTAEELMTIANMGKGTDIRMVVKDPNGVTPMSCLKRLSNMMVGLNVNLTTTNGHCMLQ